MRNWLVYSKFILFKKLPKNPQIIKLLQYANIDYTKETDSLLYTLAKLP